MGPRERPHHYITWHPVWNALSGLRGAHHQSFAIEEEAEVCNIILCIAKLKVVDDMSQKGVNDNVAVLGDNG